MRTPVDGTEPVRPTAKSGDLAAEVVHDAQRLVSLEVALAKQELKDLAAANAIAAGLVAAGTMVLVLGVLVAVPALIVVLVPAHWLAAVVWVVAYLVIGMVTVLIGRSRFQVKLPGRTLASLKENKEWAVRQMRSTVR